MVISVKQKMIIKYKESLTIINQLTRQKAVNNYNNDRNKIKSGLIFYTIFAEGHYKENTSIKKGGGYQRYCQKITYVNFHCLKSLLKKKMVNANRPVWKDINLYKHKIP
jgi:hypothetical protein